MVPMKGALFALGALLNLAGLVAVNDGWAADPENDGVKQCVKCHDESEEYPVLSILKTRHAQMGDSRTPFANKGCVTCHGESEKHLQKPAPGEERAPPDIGYTTTSATPAAERNEVCLGCHEGGKRLHWAGSRHDFEGLSCSSCHEVHAQNDKILTRGSVLGKQPQAEVCFQCHAEQRAQSYRPSRHPLLEGTVRCSDCHNPHGSRGPSLLVENTLNETCYNCHAEKRGPFLWEHPPVREDCTNCHVPHGSIHRSLLKARTPWLCQECHLATFHPSTLYSGTGIPPNGAAQQLLAKDCLNCHSKVHGSNHPSGPRKTR